MASKVIFYAYDFKKDKDAAIGSIVWDEKKMVAIGEVPEKILDELSESGIRDPEAKGRRMVFPKDGIRFLEVLKFRYDNPYLRASDVMSG